MWNVNIISFKFYPFRNFHYGKQKREIPAVFVRLTLKKIFTVLRSQGQKSINFYSAAWSATAKNFHFPSMNKLTVLKNKSSTKGMCE